MIAFRNYDARYPFLWETPDQPAGRWHADGDGPVQYLADTPDGAWAEFVRHEEITDPVDLAGISRAICAVGIDAGECVETSLPMTTLTGAEDTYAVCQAEGAALREQGYRGLKAPSAALEPGTAGGLRVDDGLTPGPARDGRVYVLFGARPELIGWVISNDARPPVAILDQVNHF